MKRLGLIAVCLLLLGVAYVHAVRTQGGPVRELAPGVFSRQGDKDARLPANTSWVEFRNFVVVIDANTPWGITAALPEIKRTTSKPIKFVFDTHYHWDHTQGNSTMSDAGITVVCSQDCATELIGEKGRGEWTSMSRRTDQYSLAPYRLEPPSVTFGEFMAFDDGERRLELRKVGPAHTIGDAVAFLPKEGILFTGDLCVNWRFGNNVGDRDADIPHWVQVLSDLGKWSPKTVVPGHGNIGTADTLKGQGAFLADLWKQVADGKKAGKTADQLAKEVDLSKHGDFAADPQQNEMAIRQVFRKVN